VQISLILLKFVQGTHSSVTPLFSAPRIDPGAYSFAAPEDTAKATEKQRERARFAEVDAGRYKEMLVGTQKRVCPSMNASESEFTPGATRFFPDGKILNIF
jgi:hypothetical protein